MRENGQFTIEQCLHALLLFLIFNPVYTSPQFHMRSLLLIFLIAIPVVIIGGILAALAGRMKEIEGGEEDEASKY